MLMCPMCQKVLTEWTRECPRCRADLSILVSYADHLQQGLARADALTRQGELGEAVWAYLEVLEVDPDNDAARRQVARVATAVRQFDRVAVSRGVLAGACAAKPASAVGSPPGKQPDRTSVCIARCWPPCYCWRR